MATSIWSGHVRFGLVHIPVRLYSAVETKDVSFHLYKEGTTERIKTRKVSAETGEPVDTTARGYTREDGEVVFVTDEDLASVASEKSKLLEITQFCSIDEIDPVYFEKSYWLGPAPKVDAEHPMELLRRTLEAEGLVGIGSFVMRGKEHVAVIRSAEGGLMLHTLFYEDEVRPASIAGYVPGVADVEERELAMARALLEAMRAPWEADRFRDEYRSRLLELIDAKATGRVPELGEAAPLGAAGVDVFAALEASIRALKGGDEETDLRIAAAGGERPRITARITVPAAGGAGAGGGDLDGLTLGELRDLARARSIGGRSKMTRDELIAALS